MSLTNKLNELKDGSKDRIPAKSLEVMGKAADELKDSFPLHEALDVGDNFPVLATDKTSQEIQKVLKNGALVVIFYRGGWCPYCNLELQAYEKIVNDIKKLGANLVAISPEVPKKSNELASKHSLSFRLLHDEDNALAYELGITFKASDELVEAYKGFGIDLVESQENSKNILPIPATYIISKSGEIIFRHLDTDYTKRVEPSDVLSVLEKL